jgi:hypothetical protein
MKHWPFKVIAKEGDKPHIRILFKGEQKDFSPEEISAMVLIKMKETAEAFLGATVTNAVITGKYLPNFFINFAASRLFSFCLRPCTLLMYELQCPPTSMTASVKPPRMLEPSPV